MQKNGVPNPAGERRRRREQQRVKSSGLRAGEREKRRPNQRGPEQLLQLPARSQGAAAAATDGGDYEGRHRQPEYRANWAIPGLQHGELNQRRQRREGSRRWGGTACRRDTTGWGRSRPKGQGGVWPRRAARPTLCQGKQERRWQTAFRFLHCRRQ